jgi:hypothetical protein
VPNGTGWCGGGYLTDIKCLTALGAIVVFCIEIKCLTALGGVVVVTSVTDIKCLTALGGVVVVTLPILSA